MPSRPWFPFFPGDYLADTRTLSLEAHGLYNLILCEYWQHGPPPADDLKLAKLLRVNPRTIRLHLTIISHSIRSEFASNSRRIHGELDRYFTIIGSELHNKRMDKEIAKCLEQKEKSENAASVRWMQPHKNHSHAIHNHNYKKDIPPIIPPSERVNGIELPEWLDKQLWFDFKEHRKKLRKPMSNKAEAINLEKLSKLRESGDDPSLIISRSIERGWSGVFPLTNGAGSTTVQGMTTQPTRQTWTLSDQELLATARQMGISTVGQTRQQIIAEIEHRNATASTKA